ncbi:MAG: riboflavin synthase [Actinomycetota bacterium]
MFTGIIEGTGRVVRLLRRGGGARLEVRAPGMLDGVKPGDSVAVNGACVTVTVVEGDAFGCDLVPETLARTTLGMVQANEEVNIERPMRADGRFDGHLVQGHVDVVGVVRSRRRVGAQEMLEINVPFELTRYLAPKGSVSLDGVSLTVVDVNRDRFRVALIPHTLSVTTLGKKIQGSTVNVEVDILSKYVERHIAARSPRPQPSLAELVKMPLRDETGPVPAVGSVPPAANLVPPAQTPLATKRPPASRETSPPQMS